MYNFLPIYILTQCFCKLSIYILTKWFCKLSNKWRGSKPYSI